MQEQNYAKKKSEVKQASFVPDLPKQFSKRLQKYVQTNKSPNIGCNEVWITDDDGLRVWNGIWQES